MSRPAKSPGAGAHRKFFDKTSRNEGKVVQLVRAREISSFIILKIQSDVLKSLFL
jgi:hypothetical protein